MGKEKEKENKLIEKNNIYLIVGLIFLYEKSCVLVLYVEK